MLDIFQRHILCEPSQQGHSLMWVWQHTYVVITHTLWVNYDPWHIGSSSQPELLPCRNKWLHFKGAGSRTYQPIRNWVVLKTRPSMEREVLLFQGKYQPWYVLTTDWSQKLRWFQRKQDYLEHRYFWLILKDQEVFSYISSLTMKKSNV